MWLVSFLLRHSPGLALELVVVGRWARWHWRWLRVVTMVTYQYGVLRHLYRKHRRLRVRMLRILRVWGEGAGARERAVLGM